MQKTDIFN